MKNYQIESVKDLLCCIDDIVRNINDGEKLDILKESRCSFYFRGESSSNYSDLKASIFREGEGDERELLRMALNKAWHQLNECKLYIEKLCYLQHHGLHTRLLDITLNPLVALYFSCSEKENENGQIYLGRKGTTSNEIFGNDKNSTIAEKTAQYLFRSNTFETYVSKEKLLGISNFSMKDFTIPLYFHTPYTNARISAQQGGFILSPLLSKNGISEEEGQICNAEEQDLKKTNIFEREYTIVVCADKKKEILNELSIYGINEGTVFPDIEHILRGINKELKNENRQNFELNLNI